MSVMAMSERWPGIKDPRECETRYNAARRIAKESQSTAIPPARSASAHSKRRPSSISPAVSIRALSGMRANSLARRLHQ